MTFHEQQECGYGFSSLPLTIRVSTDVLEWFLAWVAKPRVLKNILTLRHTLITFCFHEDLIFFVVQNRNWKASVVSAKCFLRSGGKIQIFITTSWKWQIQVSKSKTSLTNQVYLVSAFICKTKWVKNGCWKPQGLKHCCSQL